jgi:hypothetical protein
MKDIDKNFSNDSRYSSFMSEGAPYEGCEAETAVVTPIIEVSRPVWEIFQPLLETFVSNISHVRNNPQNYTVIPCLYPSRSMADYLNQQNNFRAEYFVLFNDQIVNYILSVIDGTHNLRNYIVDSTFDSHREGILHSITISRDSFIQLYSRVFTEVPQTVLENNVLNHFNTLIENLASAGPNTFLGYEVSAFAGTFLINLPPDQWLPFIESVLCSSGTNGYSVHHYQLLFSVWGAENTPVSYSDFQPMLVNSVEFYKELNSSFHQRDFNLAVFNEIGAAATSAIQNSQLADMSTLTSMTSSANATFNSLAAQQLNDIANIPVVSSGSDAIRRVLSFVSWLASNPTFLSTAFIVVGGAASIFRGPALEWYRGPRGNPLGDLSDWQRFRGSSTDPIVIIDEPVSIPEMPTVPDITPFIEYFAAPSPQLGVAGGIIIVSVLVIKKTGLGKIISIFFK